MQNKCTSFLPISLKKIGLILLATLMVTSVSFAQEELEADTLRTVTVVDEEIKNVIKGILDIKALKHSVAVGRIAKDQRLTKFIDGFMVRNDLRVFTLSYIDENNFWPRVFKNSKFRELNKIPRDKLLEADVIFKPHDLVYDVELVIKGHSNTVFELLELNASVLDSIASSVHNSNLSGEFSSPGEARELAVSALIESLTEIERYRLIPATSSDELETIEPSKVDEVLIKGLSRNPELVTINEIQDEFIPTKERLDITYTLVDTLGLKNNKLEMFAIHEGDTVLFNFYTQIPYGTAIEFMDRDNDHGWKGVGTDNEIGRNGDYLIKLTATIDQSYLNGFEDYEVIIIYSVVARIWEQLDAKDEMSAVEIKAIRRRIDSLDSNSKKFDLYLELQKKVPYHSQRDNNNPAADYMCNVTSLAMCLEMMGVSNPKPNMQFEDYLDSLRVKSNYGHRTLASSRRKLAQKFGIKQSIRMKPDMTKTSLTAFLKPKIQSGNGVMISVGGHLVRLQGLTSTGLIIDDPFGRINLLSRYKTNSNSFGRGVNSRDDTGLNGIDNLWEWTEIEKVQFKYIECYYE